MRRLLAIGFITIAVVGAGGGFLLLELNKANADLGEARAEAQRQRTLNDELASGNAELTTTLTSTQTELADVRNQNDTLETLLSSANEDISTSTLQTDLGKAQSGLADA